MRSQPQVPVDLCECLPVQSRFVTGESENDGCNVADPGDPAGNGWRVRGVAVAAELDDVGCQARDVVGSGWSLRSLGKIQLVVCPEGGGDRLRGGIEPDRSPVGKQTKQARHELALSVPRKDPIDRAELDERFGSCCGSVD